MYYPVETSSFDKFKASIRNLPVLSEEEEKDLVKKYREDNCQLSVQKLILHNLRFVAYVVNSYRGYGVNEEDLIQEGTIGLMKAVKKYTLDQGVRLSTYAIHYIRNQIIEYVIKNFRIFKVATTKAQRKLFFNLKKLKHLSDKEISEELDVPEYEVATMRERFLISDTPFVATETDDTEETQYSPHLYLEAPDSSPEQITEESRGKDQIQTMLSVLNNKQRYIVEQRILRDDPVPFKVLADEYGVSHQRIEQILKSALKKLRKYQEIN